MLVVSGEMRSGTSLMMLILKRLGVICAGEKVPKGTRPEMNPTGMWEILGVSMAPFTKQTIDEHNITEECIKIISHGLFYSDMSLIDKVIYCIRDPREIIVSQRNQMDHRGDEYCYNWYNVHTAALITFMELGKMPPTLFVNYKDMMKNPRRQVRRVAEFIDRPYKGKAAKVVNKRYYRSKAHMAEDDETARKYYNYLKGLCV